MTPHFVTRDPTWGEVLNYLERHGIRKQTRSVVKEGTTYEIHYLVKDNESGLTTRPCPDSPLERTLDYGTVRSICNHFGVPRDGLYTKV